jgi:hypothetical protein
VPGTVLGTVGREMNEKQFLPLGANSLVGERDVNINYNGVMNTLIKFKAGCSAAPQSCREVNIYFSSAI